MNASNTVILIGRLTADPEVRWTNDQKCIARFRLAVDRPYGNNGQHETDFINCVAFGNRGEFAQKYLQKGTKVAIGGEIRTGSYQRQDGSKAYTTDVNVDTYTFVESRQQNSGYQAQPNNNQQNGYRQQQAPQQGYQQQYQPAPQPAPQQEQYQQQTLPEGFMQIPGSVDDSGLPWN